jgi:3-hydroxyisobutyrate dehydrogenase
MGKRLGFVGLGVMGLPMAGHLLRQEHALTVWNRTKSKTESLAAAGAKVADSLEELGAASDFVFICVNRSEDVRSVLDGLIQGAKPGTMFVDHSTILPDDAKALASELAENGFRFVDAPITGGSMGAQKGQLTIFMGGAPEDVEELQPIVQAYAKRAERVGGNGAGQLAKMVNQIAVGGALLALCESLSFAKKAGLDVRQIRELVGGGAAGSWAFENYGEKILNEDWSPGFSIKNQRKDLGYCIRAAERVDACVPGTKLVDSLLAPLEEQGHGEWTTAALFVQLLSMGSSE